MPHGYFQDGQGNKSSMRIMSFIGVFAGSTGLLLLAIAELLGKSTTLGIPLATVVAAGLGGKAAQKFVKTS